MKGTVKFFDEKKGFGFIKPEDASDDIFVHVKDLLAEGHTILIENEPVEFTVEENGKRRAVKLRRLEVRITGRVASFEHGWGKIKPADDGDPVFVHFSDILGTGFKTLEEGEAVEFSIAAGDKGPKAVRVKRLDTRLPLERYAAIRDLGGTLAQLAEVAQRENWNYRYAKSKYQFPILRSYLFYTFERLQAEGKLLEVVTPNKRAVACFNTGLWTQRYEAIYGYCTEIKNAPPGEPRWNLDGVFNESDKRFTAFSQRPDIANYFTDPSEVIYDTRIRLVPRIDHIVQDRDERFPERFRDDEFALIGALTSAIEFALKRVKRNYKTAIPQFNRGRVQLLLPLCLQKPETADLALLVSKEQEVYEAATVLTLDMAYNNARLLARPDTEWLDP